MSRLPFIIPEKDLSLRISVIVMILERLSYTKRNKLILNLDKLAIYEFLVTQPFVLHELVKKEPKFSYFSLQENEKDSIRTKYINTNSLVDYSAIKELIQVLLFYDFVKIKQEKNDFFYVITQDGTDFINSIESNYLTRIRELCDVVGSVTTLSSSNLKQLINSILGV